MFGLTDKLIAIAAGIGCLVLTGLLLIQTGALHKAERRADKAEVTLSQDREAAATANAQLVQKARETEQSLTAKAAQIEGEKNEQITALDARAADLRKRLRNAEASAATARLVSGLPATAPAGDTAGERDRPELLGPLGYDAVSEAERADQIRFQLAACTRQYNAARDAMR